MAGFDASGMIKNLISNGMLGASKAGSVAPMQIDPASGQFVPEQGHPFLGALNTIRPVVDFGSGVYSAYAGGQDRGLAFAGLGNMMNNMAQRNYMNQMQQQAMREYMDQKTRQNTIDANNANIWNSRTGQSVQGPFDTTFANNSAPDIRQSNAVPSINGLLQGKPLQLDPYGNYDPSLIELYLKRQGEAANYLTNGGAQAIQDGQNNSRIGNPALPQVGTQAPMPEQGRAVPTLGGTMYMDPSASLGPAMQPMLNGAASYSAPGKQIPMDISPFLLPTDIPVQVAGNQQAGLRDAQEFGKLTETTRSNKANERRIPAQNARDYAAANLDKRTNPNLRGGGGGGDPFASSKFEQSSQGNQAQMLDNAEQSLNAWAKQQGVFNADGTLNKATPAYNAYARSMNDINTKRSNLYMGALKPLENAPSASGMVSKQNIAVTAGRAQIRSAGDWLKNRGR